MNMTMNYSTETESQENTQIFPVLINYERNQEFLKEVPHERFLDLAITYHYSNDKEKDCIITNNDLNHGRFKKEDFEKISFRGNPMTTEKFLNVFGMQSITTQESYYGANMMLFLDKILEEDYYILPSSIHEIIILPEKAVTNNGIEFCKQVVSEVNSDRGCIQEDEILSYNVYKYEKDKGIVIV